MSESCAVVTRQLNKGQRTDIHQNSGHPGVKRTRRCPKNLLDRLSELVKPANRLIQRQFVGIKGI